MNNKKDITKNDLYNSVKSLIEEESQHLHFNQQKLFTLFSIAFQYMLYRSTKESGAYIVRIEDSHLAEKLARKSKDESTRKFMQRILLPRRLKYLESTLYLDFFHPGTWSITKDIAPEKIKGAIIVKNTNAAPMNSFFSDDADPAEADIFASLPANYYLTSLTNVAAKTITIAFEHQFPDLKIVNFNFIKDNEEVTAGVRIARNIDLSNID